MKGLAQSRRTRSDWTSIGDPSRENCTLWCAAPLLMAITNLSVPTDPTHPMIGRESGAFSAQTSLAIDVSSEPCSPKTGHYEDPEPNKILRGFPDLSREVLHFTPWSHRTSLMHCWAKAPTPIAQSHLQFGPSRTATPSPPGSTSSPTTEGLVLPGRRCQVRPRGRPRMPTRKLQPTN